MSNHNPDRPGCVNGLRSTASAVFMAMMDVRVVRVPVSKRFMPAPVRMRFRHRSFVSVLMMRIVDMGMLVLDWLVHVFMGEGGRCHSAAATPGITARVPLAKDMAGFSTTLQLKWAAIAAPASAIHDSNHGLMDLSRAYAMLIWIGHA
jgi:hypothetical protein